MKHSNNDKIKTHPEFLYYFFFLTIVTLIIIFKDQEKTRLVKTLLHNKLFLMSLSGIIIFSIYNLRQKEHSKEIKHQKKATKAAILGFIIAIMAYLDLKAAPFWIIWFVSYYLDE